MEPLEYGISRLSIVPVRAGASDASEMISQLLFGEHYAVLEISKNKQWFKIQNAFDNYEGWIDAKQHSKISFEYYDQVNNTEYKICTNLVSEILYGRNVIHITLGAVLPILNNPLFNDQEKFAFNGDAKSLHQKWNVDQMIALSKKYLNAPYLWGGKSPFGIDCSGFTQVVFRVAGYKLPRDSKDQITKGKEVKFENAMPGDLVFFTNKTGKMNHVGIVLPNGQVIHSSGRVRIDQLDAQGIFSVEQNAYSHTLFKIKRVLRDYI
ncbi:MAG: cell wall-associated NlpC family hydrolase [Roseivirga sp.]|jgi:cell wall-associated NlpC family hydrolase